MPEAVTRMSNRVLPIEPITDDTLREFCTFLSQHLNSHIRPEQWEAGFRVSWDCRRPNYGFLLRDPGGQIAGGLGAMYSRQIIDGREYDFCNLTSWCVKEEYRSQSMRLAIQLTEQAGFEITNFSPTAVVAKLLRFLDFRELDERVSYFPNLPLAGAASRASRVEWNAAGIERSLSGDLARIYRDHAAYPWLQCALLEEDGRQ